MLVESNGRMERETMEQMKPKQVIEILKNLTCVVPKDKAEETKQAIDHAINCVGAIEQIKWERDIAIQQLNELGYDLGEKIREEDKRVKIISETIDGVKTGLIIPKADKE